MIVVTEPQYGSGMLVDGCVYNLWWLRFGVECVWKNYNVSVFILPYQWVEYFPKKSPVLFVLL